MFEAIRLEGDFSLSSGSWTPFYYDFDLLTPIEVKIYAKKLVDSFRLNGYEFPFVATPALGGVTLAFQVAQFLNIPLIIVEKDGTIRGDAKVLCNEYLIIDDVVSSYTAVDFVQGALKCQAWGVASYIFRGSMERPELHTLYLQRKETELCELD